MTFAPTFLHCCLAGWTILPLSAWEHQLTMSQHCLAQAQTTGGSENGPSFNCLNNFGSLNLAYIFITNSQILRDSQFICIFLHAAQKHLLQHVFLNVDFYIRYEFCLLLNWFVDLALDSICFETHYVITRREPRGQPRQLLGQRPERPPHQWLQSASSLPTWKKHDFIISSPRLPHLLLFSSVLAFLRNLPAPS